MKPDPSLPRMELEALSVGYQGVPLIRDISLSLKKGEILTLIGPNGSGKSTILKSITRHLQLIAGTVYIDQKNMRTLSGKELAERLAVVLTERVRPELMNCFEFVSAGRYPYTGSFGRLTKEDRAVVEDALRRVHTLDIAGKDISEISDGQRQRILLARAIAQEPEVIVLDEPTSYLDVKHKIELLEILSDMAKKQGISVVMSLHEIDLAERISDKIACIKGDRIAAYGTPEEIFSDETVRELYDIRSGSFNALIGNIELKRPEGDVRCFVVGGAGTGIPYYRALQKLGVPFAAGILPENDLDMAAARPLAVKLLSVPPYTAAKDADIREAERIIDEVSYVADCGCPTGEYNRANAGLIAYAEQKGKTVLRSLTALSEVFQ